MGKDQHQINPIIPEYSLPARDLDVDFYLEEMQKMNNRMIDMQRELNRALRESQRAQEQLRQSAQLKAALAQAEQANQAKMDFMSRMSHDLRTPMNVIMGLTALTLDAAEDPKAVRDNMARIRRVSDYMLGLVNDILDMAKAERGSVQLKLEPYASRDFMMEMRTMFQAQCQAKGIAFACHDLPDNPVLMADRHRLGQVIFNIISNAVKYTPVGGAIDVTARQVSQDEKNITLEYTVRDNGIGMSEEFQQHLFEPFVQEDRAVSPELKGSGLGLSITKRLVERMSGAITVDSQKGQGTTVVVTLPFALAPQPQAAPDPAQDEDFSLLGGKTVLLAEDHPMNAMIARALLEKMHMSVIHGENGKKAVELFAASPVGSLDAVLMDIRMPEMNGLEAAQAIRALGRPDAATVPIIALSANAYPSDVQASLDAGMNAHLPKPIEPKTLFQTLKKCFSVR